MINIGQHAGLWKGNNYENKTAIQITTKPNEIKPLIKSSGRKSDELLTNISGRGLR